MAEIHNKLGFIYFLQTRYPEAIRAFKEALRLKPGLFTSNLGLGMSLFRYSSFEEAVVPLKAAHDLNPADPQGMFFLGSTYLSLERFEEAVPLFLQLVRVSPQDQDALYALTLAAEKLYVECFVSLARLYPESARAHQIQAQRLAISRKWDEAIAEFQKALAASPRLEQVHLAIGDIYAKQGLQAQAGAEYEKELAINPFEPLARAGLEKVTRTEFTSRGAPVAARSSSATVAPDSSRLEFLVQSRQCPEALALMNAIPEGGSSPAIPWQWKVQCLLELGDFDSLINALAKTRSDDVEALYWKGLAMQQLTFQTYEPLTHLEHDSARVHELTGRLAAESDDELAALREFRLAEARDPDLPGIHYAIGHILMRNRQLQNAVSEFLAELKADPYNPVVQCELGSAYLNLRKPDEGIPLLEAGLERRPDLVDAHRDLGRAYGQKGNWEKAITQFQVVAAARPDDYSIHMLLGDAYRKLGRITEAEAEFRNGREQQAADLAKTQGLAKSILHQDGSPSSEALTAPSESKKPH